MREFYTNATVLGGKVLLRGYSDGKPFRERVEYKPYHFIPSSSVTEWCSIDGKPISRIDFDSIYEAKDFFKKYEEVDNFAIYGYTKYVYPFLHDRYKELVYDESMYDIMSVVYMDIEVAADQGFPEPTIADKPINAISMKKKGHTFIVGTVDYTPHRDDITYAKCRDEKELLYTFLDIWEKLDPDIVSGWNVEYFDVTYLVNRITEILGETEAKRLSPWRRLHEKVSKDKFDNEMVTYDLLGITVIDMMAAYKKFSFKNQESYSLNHIASVELGEKKIDYSEYENLFDLYIQNPQLFIEYNVQDNDLVERLAIKTGLIKQIMAIAYNAKVNYADAFTSVLLWEVIIGNYLLEHKMAIPAGGKRNRKINPIMGAFVKAPQVGRHKWVIGLDLDSLYPHLIMGYNISPETFVKSLRSLRDMVTVEDILDGKLMDNELIRDMVKGQGYGYTPNGCFFKNDKRGFLPALMDTMYADRKKFKKQMGAAKKENEAKPSDELRTKITQLNNLQMALKICLNSAYGALSNEWFAFFDIDLAEAITYAGQLAIKFIAKKLNNYFNTVLDTKNVDYVLAMDTDSCYLTLDGLVSKVLPGETDVKKITEFLEKVCDSKINPLIEEWYVELKDMTNAYEQKMSMKVESISEAGIWKAKKRYALKMIYDEGVYLNEPAIKIKGIEAVQSSTPSICRDSIKKCLRYILDGDKDTLYRYVDEFEKTFRSSPFESVAYTSSISDVQKYMDENTIYGKGAQAHIKGALIYNHYLREKKLTDRYQRIHNGDKIKCAYLTMPNPIRQEVISVYNKLPDEFGLRKYVDYDKQFQKEFIDPVNGIAKLVGWDIQNRATLESFFG